MQRRDHTVVCVCVRVRGGGVYACVCVREGGGVYACVWVRINKYLLFVAMQLKLVIHCHQYPTPYQLPEGSVRAHPWLKGGARHAPSGHICKEPIHTAALSTRNM